MFTILVCLGAGLLALRRKSWAQAECVRVASALQAGLARPLRELFSLNRQATSLRRRRARADHAVEVASRSLNPAALTTALALRHEVVLEQLALRARQLALLREAARLRAGAVAEFHRVAGALRARGARSRPGGARDLAVEASPPASLSPDYRPRADFLNAQAQAFAWQIDLLEGFPFVNAVWQGGACNVSLEERNSKWDIRILAARASSNSV